MSIYLNMCNHVIDIEITNRKSLKLFFSNHVSIIKIIVPIKLKEPIISIFSCMFKLDNFAKISLLKRGDLIRYCFFIVFKVKSMSI